MLITWGGGHLVNYYTRGPGGHLLAYYTRKEGGGAWLLITWGGGGTCWITTLGGGGVTCLLITLGKRGGGVTCWLTYKQRENIDEGWMQKCAECLDSSSSYFDQWPFCYIFQTAQQEFAKLRYIKHAWFHHWKQTPSSNPEYFLVGL